MCCAAPHRYRPRVCAWEHAAELRPEVAPIWCWLTAILSPTLRTRETSLPFGKTEAESNADGMRWSDLTRRAPAVDVLFGNNPRRLRSSVSVQNSRNGPTWPIGPSATL